MAELTDVDAEAQFDLEELPDEAEVTVGHYELGEPKDVRISESLGEGIHLQDVEYVLANRVHTPLTQEDKFMRLRNMDGDAMDDYEDMEEAVEDQPDEITVSEIIHSDADGGSGIKLMQVESEDSLDEIIDRFADEDDE